MEWVFWMVTPPVSKQKYCYTQIMNTVQKHLKSKERNLYCKDAIEMYLITNQSIYQDELQFYVQFNFPTSHSSISDNTYISSSTNRIFLFRASMALISPSVSEKFKICNKIQYDVVLLKSSFVFYMAQLCVIYFHKLTWKLCWILSGLKLLGITTTPLWTLKRRATWALLLLYFLPIDTSSSSSSSGGLFTFTLKYK